MFGGPNIFAGLGNAPIFERGEYMDPGWYDLTLRRLLTKNTQNSGLGFIAEFDVVASSVDKHPAGHQVTWFQGMSDPKIAMPALKQFFAALLGFQTSDAQAIAQLSTMVEPLALWGVSERNALMGWSVRTINEMTMTRGRPGKPPGPFTRHNFQPFPYEHYNMVRPDMGALVALISSGPPPMAAPQPAATPWGALPAAPAWGAPAPAYAPPAAPAMPWTGSPPPGWGQR